MPRTAGLTGRAGPRHNSFVDRLPEAATLGLLLVIPSFIDLSSVRVFEEPKALLLRAGAIVLLAVAAAGGFRLWRDGTVWRHPVTLSLVALTAAIVVSSTLSVLPRLSWWGAYSRQHGVLTWLALVVVYLAVACAARDPASRARIVWATIAASVIPAVYALAQVAGRDPVEWSWVLPGRAGSTFGNPILLGGYLAAVIPLTAAVALFSLQRAQTLNRLVAQRFSAASAVGSAALKRRATLAESLKRGATSGPAGRVDRGSQRDRGGRLPASAQRRGQAVARFAHDGWQPALGSLILLLQLAALLATGSRGPLIGLVAAAGVAMVLAAAMQPRPRARILLGSIALALALGAAGIGFGPGRALAERALDMSQGSARVRMLIWQSSLEAVRADPLRTAIGYGPETFRAVYVRHYAPELARAEQSQALPDRAHNDTLDALVTTGVAGAAAMLIVYACVITTGLGLLWRSRAASAVHAASEDAASGDTVGRNFSSGKAANVSSGKAANVSSGNPVLTIGLIALVVAHVVEVQLGIATVASRVQVLVAAALLVALSGRLKPAPARAASEDAAYDTVGRNFSSGKQRNVSSGVFPARSAAWRLIVALSVAAVAVNVVSVRPARADWLARQARELERQRRFQESAVRYREAAALAPAVDDYLTGLARTLMEDDAFAGAADTLERASSLAPFEVDHPRNLGRLHRAWAGKTPEGPERTSHFQAADAAYTNAAAIAPAMPSTWIEWATSDLEQQRLESAGEKLDRAAALDDKVPMLWLMRGHLRARVHDLPGALAAFDRAVALEPGFVLALRGRATMLVALDRREEATAALQELEKRSIDDPTAVQLRQQLGPRPRPIQ